MRRIVDRARMLSTVGTAPIPARRRPRQDVFYGAGAEPPLSSLVVRRPGLKFGTPTPL
eukprot:SAG31_NODE_4845_length_2908_cov_5.326095_5_plen_58_part_00